MFAIFGFREMSWPRGDGYLYLRLQDGSDLKPLMFLHLYKTSDGEFDELLRARLASVVAELGLTAYKTENMSGVANKIFAEIAAPLGLKPAS